MLCGTPIAAMKLGAVPEIVEENISGCMAATREEFVSVIPKCLALDRRKIRERAMQRFSVERMAREYANLYARLAARK